MRPSRTSRRGRRNGHRQRGGAPAPARRSRNAELHGDRRARADAQTALSYMQAHQKPYRVDGTPVMKPTGAEMVLSESWRFEAAKRRADDCDGSAAR